MRSSGLPIGVFDSGIGGLTVLRALRLRLPHEPMVYLGDTARLPYGTKTGKTIESYALQASDHLVASGIKLLVVACNTASAYALPALQQRHPGLPIIGVIEPPAAEACRVSKSGRIAVIATEATVRAGAYQQAIARLRPKARVEARACSLLVGLAEEGWVEGAVADVVLRRYLEPLLSPEGESPPDCLVLGCTHFPLLRQAIAAIAGPNVGLVDSSAVVDSVVGALARHELAVEGEGQASLRLLATDGAERFATLAALFLGMPLSPDRVELVALAPAR